MSIPKIIHYCWFGRGKKPADILYYIDTWKKYLPDYQIIEWNEDNFSIENSNQYVKEAYNCKKWAFVSDYVRLYALNLYGGIYFDTDVEVFKTFNPLLNCCCFLGFESKDYLSTAVMGAKKKFPIIQCFMNEYDSRSFILNDGKMDVETTNVVTLTKMMLKLGLKPNGKRQNVEDVTVYPQSYFSANDFINIFNRYSKTSYAFHHYNASWYEGGATKGVKKRVRHYLLGVARNLFGTSRLYNLRHKG